ncbi:MAG: heavy metal translocating P-type ATPase, partial [Clostridia bacterium]
MGSKTNSSYRITGMTCASCAARIEKMVGRMEGVQEVAVNLAAETMSVAYESPATAESVMQTVERIGFGAQPQKRGAQAAKEAALSKDQAIRTLWTKFIVASAFALPLLYLAMGPMLGLPVPAFLSPETAPLTFALVQLCLTIPVIIAGNQFYRVGTKAILQRSPNMDSLIAMGTSASLLYSLYSTVRIAQGDMHAVHGLYFESVGVIIALILLGKSLEAISKGRTSDAIKKLMGLTPKTAIVVKNGVETEIPMEAVLPGDLL